MGHSQGTSQMFYALATNQDYLAKKVNLFVALAPVLQMKHANSDVKKVAKSLPEIKSFYDNTDIYYLGSEGLQHSMFSMLKQGLMGALMSSLDSVINAVSDSSSKNHVDNPIS